MTPIINPETGKPYQLPQKKAYQKPTLEPIATIRADTTRFEEEIAKAKKKLKKMT